MRLVELMGDDGAEIVVHSAGVRAEDGKPMDESAAQELARLGGRVAGFLSRQLVDRYVHDADLVLTATKELRSQVLELVPSALRRTFTLTEFATLVDGAERSSLDALVADAAVRRPSAQLPTYDIDDPIGASAEVHREVADQIDRCTRAIASALATAVKPALR